MDEWMSEWVDRGMDGGGREREWVGGCTDGWRMGSWMNGSWMDGLLSEDKETSLEAVSIVQGKK